MGSVIYDSVIAGMGKMDVDLIYRMLGAPDDPTGYNRAIQSLKTARDTLKALHVRSGVKDTRVKAWVVTKDSNYGAADYSLKNESTFLSKSLNSTVYSNGNIELTVGDNDTAKIVDGILEFDGNATLNVKALNNAGGTLYIDMGDEDIFEYNIEVVKEHECYSDKWVTVLPSVDGSVAYQACYCDTCSELIGFREVENCVNHKFNDWTVSSKATCTVGGLKTRECTVCGYVETEFTDANGHNEETRNKVEAICTKDGYTGDVYCTVCNELVSQGEIIKALGHDYVIEETSATCLTSGYTTYTCSVCGDTYTDNELKPLGHTKVIIGEAKEATCTEDGITAGIKCSVCGEIIEPQQVIKATGHTDGKWIVDEDADCINGGTKHQVCSVCEETIATEVIPANGHKYVSVTIDPTCTTDGTLLKTCATCGYKVEETLPKTNHIDNDGDGYCDDCSIIIDDPSANCSCNCHKSGIVKFFWKIANFFHKIFKMKKYHYCNCGVAHW